MLSADLSLIEQGLPDFLTSLQGQLNADVFSAPAPLIGDQLASATPGQFPNTVAANLGDSWLQTDPSETVTIEDVKDGLEDLIGGNVNPIGNDGDTEIRFQWTLTDTISGVVDLDLALGADPIIEPLLGIDGVVQVSADWNFQLTFGVSQGEFFIDTAANGELEVIVAATLPNGFSAKGKAGVFGALITADVPSTPPFNGTYDVDLVDANADNKLFTTEYAQLELDATLTGSADVNLYIDASFIPDFAYNGDRDSLFNLAVTADAAISYKFDNADTQEGPFGDPVIVDYQNIELNLGTFFSEFVDPTVEKIQEALKPLKPVVDFLTDPVPVISELSGDDVSMLDLASFVAAGNAELTRPIEKAKTVVNFIDEILELQTPVAQGLGQMDLGTFAAEVTVDLNSDEASDVQKTDEKEAEELLDELKKGEGSAEFFTDFAATIQFPFLENPDLIFAMLMGDKTADLVTFGIDFSFGFEFGYTYPIIPGLLNAELGLRFEAALDFDAGYDTFGAAALTNSLDFSDETSLEQSVDANIHRLADGFYFDDHNDNDPRAQDGDVDITDDTKDQPELTLKAEMWAGASVGANLLVFNVTAGVNLVFGTHILFDLNDLPEPQNEQQADYVHDLLEGDENVEVPTGNYTYDGRVRIGELQLITSADAAGVFNYSGALTVGMDAFVKVIVGVGLFKFTLVNETYELFNEVIYEFNIYQLEDSRVLAGERLNAPVIGNVDDNNTLKLYMGDTASSRKHTGLEGQHESPLETRESFSVTSLGPTDPNDLSEGETLEVIFQAWDPGTGQWVARGKERFNNVKQIEAFGGTGNDRILVDDTVAVPVHFEGGDGDDLLSYAGSGSATLSGNGGDDKLLGGGGDDSLDGGSGNDELLGGGGADDLIGGDGKDRLDGQAGKDSLAGGEGGDTYIWYVGTDNDTFSEDVGAAGSVEEYDHISIRGAIQVVPADVRDGTPGVIELDDVIELIGNGEVTVQAGSDTITVNNIESIGVAAGGGADTIILGNLGHTNVQELSIDLSSPDEAGQTDGDTVIVKGSETGDNIDFIELKGERAAPPQGAPASTGKPMVQISHATGSTQFDAVILNSDPARDRLQISGYGGDDQLTVAAGEDGVRIQDLIAVTLDGGEGNDTLSTIYSNVDIIGGVGSDHLVVVDDVNSPEMAYINLEDDNVAVALEEGATVPEHLITYAGMESFNLKLGPRDANQVRLLSTIAGPVETSGSTNDETIDHVIIPRDRDTNGLTGELTANAISGLGYAADTITYSDLEELTLDLGSGADQLTIESTGAVATTVKGNNGEDTVTLSIRDPNVLTESPFDGLSFSVETLVVDHTGDEATAWRVEEGSVWVDQVEPGVRIVDVAGADRVTFDGGVNGTDTLTVADPGPESQTVTLEDGTIRVQPAGRVLSFNSLTFELAPGQLITSGTIESSLEVSEFPNAATVTDVEITVDIGRDSTMTNDDLKQLIDNGNLKLTLLLSTTVGGKSSELQHPLLIDQDGHTVVVARLSAFNDEKANDNWTLKVEADRSIGTLSSWSLQVTDDRRDYLDDPPAAFAPLITDDGEYVYSVGPLESGENAVKAFWRNADNGHLSLLPEESTFEFESGWSSSSAAISADTAIIGAPDQEGGIDSAYLFERDATGKWTQQQNLTANDGEQNDQFGYSVAIDGDTAVIGAYGDDDFSGSAYVFTRKSGVWMQQQKLIALDRGQYDAFGHSVAVYGDTAVIGADWDNDLSGSAYVFTRASGAWTQQQKLTAETADDSESFGGSVAIYGDTAVIGAVQVPGFDYSGSAYVFTRTSGEWTQQHKLTGDGNQGDSFGSSVAIYNDTALIGAEGDSSAYVFGRDENGFWLEEPQKLTAEDGYQFDSFGHSVAIDGDTAVIGAEGNGSAYIFERNASGEWTQQKKFDAPFPLIGIGDSVAIFGDTVVTGHPFGSPGETGVAQFFQLPVGIGAGSIGVSPDDQYLYVARPGANGTVSVYRREMDSVTLSTIQTVAAGENPLVTVSPDGQHVYVTLFGGKILKYDRDVVTGKLSNVSELQVGSYQPAQRRIVFDDAGGHAYVASAVMNMLEVFQRDADTGDLTPLDPPQVFVDGDDDVDGLAGPVDLALSPDQNYLYVAGRDDNAIAVFARDVDSGGLQFVGHARNGADGVRGLRGAASLVVTEDYVFAVGKQDDSLVVFNRDADGLLTFVQRLSNGRGGIAGLENPNSVIINPDGNWLYVTSAGDGEDHPGGVAWFGVHQDVLPAAPLFVSYSGIGELIVQTGSGNDRVSVLGVGEQIDTLAVMTNAGDDRVVVQELRQDVATTFQLGEGFDELDLHNTGQRATTEIAGGEDDDTIRVWGTAEDSATTIEGGDGSDEIRVTLDTLQATVEVYGDSSTAALAASTGDTLLFDTGGANHVDEDGTVRVEGASYGVEYSNIANLEQLNAPLANAGGPYNINEGDSLTLDASGYDLRGQTLVSVEWDVDSDGQFGDLTGSQQPQLTWSDLVEFGLDDDGEYQVAVRVNTSEGYDIAATTVTINNVEPILEISSGPTPDDQFTPYVIHFAATDFGDDTISNWGIDWGDGSGGHVQGNEAAASHKYAPGSYTVEVNEATDEDRTYTLSWSQVITVEALDLLSGDSDTEEGQTYELTLDGSPAFGNPTWIINWGDGSSIESFQGVDMTLEHAFLDDSAGGEFEIHATVQTDDGSYTATKLVTVANVAPVLKVAGKTSIEEGNRQTLYLLASDPGADTISTWTIAWGDESEITIAGSSKTISHLYADDGDYSITVTAKDEDSAEGQSYRATQVASLDRSVFHFSAGLGATDHFYTLSSQQDWDDLSVEASESGGYLATITSEQEQRFLDEAFFNVAQPPEKIWINNFFLDDGELVWPTGEPLEYTSWAENEPSSPDGGPIAMSRQSEPASGDPLSRWAVMTGDEEFLGIIELNSIDKLVTWDTGDVLTVTVDNALPRVDLDGPAQVAEGSTFTLVIGPPVDNGLDQVTRYIIDWGDESDPLTVDAPQEGFKHAQSFTHVYGDGDSNYAITLQLVDEDDTHDNDIGFTAQIVNVAPVLTIRGATSVNEGSEYTLTLSSVFDPGEDLVDTYEVDWGDGTNDSLSSLGDVTHIYVYNGVAERTITVDLVDQDGTYLAAATQLVSVNDIQPMIALSGEDEVNGGSVYTLTLGEVTDPGQPGTIDVDLYTVHWGDGSTDTYTQGGEVTHQYADDDFTYTIIVDLNTAGETYLSAGRQSVTVNALPADPVVNISPAGPGGAPDPADLPGKPAQPTAWATQRSDLRQIVIDLGLPISNPTASSLVLTNLGVNAPVDADVVVPLSDSQLALSTDGKQLTISFAANALVDGVYQLTLTSALTGAAPFTFAGNATNKFFVLKGDWNGTGGVNIQDFATFAYWFGIVLPTAPDYVDTNNTGGINIQDFAAFAANFGKSITFPAVAAPVSSGGGGKGELASLMQTLVNPTDVNGDGSVTARDALNVIHELARGSANEAWSRYDANQDGSVTVRDALFVINRLAEQPAAQIASLPLQASEAETIAQSDPGLPNTPEKLKMIQTPNSEAFDAALLQMESSSRDEPASTSIAEMIELLSQARIFESSGSVGNRST